MRLLEQTFALARENDFCNMKRLIYKHDLDPTTTVWDDPATLLHIASEHGDVTYSVS